MNVNENIDAFASFLSSHEHQFLDEDNLLHVDPIEEDPALISKTVHNEDFNPKNNTPFHKGDTVEFNTFCGTKIYIVMNYFKTALDLLCYKMRTLRMEDIIVVDPKDITAFKPNYSYFLLDITACAYCDIGFVYRRSWSKSK